MEEEKRAKSHDMIKYTGWARGCVKILMNVKKMSGNAEKTSIHEALKRPMLNISKKRRIKSMLKVIKSPTPSITLSLAERRNTDGIGSSPYTGILIVPYR